MSLFKLENDKNFNLPKKWGIVQPKFLFTLVGILVVLGGIIGYIEISQGRSNVMELLKKEAKTVTEALTISAKNAVQAYSEVEEYIKKHLFHTATLLDHLESEKVLTPTTFKKLMQESGLTKAFYIDPKIKIHNYAFPNANEQSFQPEILRNFLRPLLSPGKKRLSAYVRDKENHLHFVVALKSNSGLIWVLSSQPSVMKDLRKRIGIGGIIQSIGENEEIVYIVLQDKRGIISATKNVSSISSIDSEPFISEAWADDSLITRVTLFNDKDVFEVVKPLWVSGNKLGLIRTGMSMKAANKAMKRTLQRALAVLVGFVVIGVILFNLFINNQNYNLLTDAYAKIKTYTGNILENMADAVVVVDKNRKITLFNQAAEKLFNIPSTKAIGSLCSHIIGRQTSLLDETLLGGEEIRDKEVEYNLNSKTIVLSVTTRLIKNEKGAIDSAVAVLKDLTEKKEYEKRLQRNEKLTAMGELASGVAHEIRNPLNAIGIIAQRFLYEFEVVANKVEFTELANAVISATQKVSSIIQRFLEFARPAKLDLQKTILNESIKKSVVLVESLAKEKGISLHFEAQKIIGAFIDPNQVEQVLINILQNAIQATAKAGKVFVSLNKLPQVAEIIIKDTGAGIEKDKIDRIFDLYFTTKRDGTGMGLSISHQIISEHNGKIEVESTTGKGTTFTITLPLNKDEA